MQTTGFLSGHNLRLFTSRDASNSAEGLLLGLAYNHTDTQRHTHTNTHTHTHIDTQRNTHRHRHTHMYIGRKVEKTKSKI